MQDDALLAALRQSDDAGTVAALERLIRDGTDEELAHVNALRFAAEQGLDEDAVIAALLHASRLGLFEMSWNILCGSCGGVLDANATLKHVRHESYHCAFCSLDNDPVLDDGVEVSFGLSPRIRAIAAHDPDALGYWDYHRQVFFGTGVAIAGPPDFEPLARASLLETVELEPGAQTDLTVDLPTDSATLFDPVTHTAHVLEAEGEPTRERRELALVFNEARPPLGRTTFRPGPLRLTLDNRSDRRVLPGVFVQGDALTKLIGGRRPFLTAKRLLTNQTFRDVYRTETLAIDQRLKIVSLAFLFTDLKGSTALYERVGDLVAYDLVRAHFRVMAQVVAAQRGAVVKTIGDAVMATFSGADQALAAALAIRESMRELNAKEGAEALIVKIGLHAGPCLVVQLNDQQDFFGRSVNIASRVQQLATSDTIFATEAIVRDGAAARLLGKKGIDPQPQAHSLRGIADRVTVFELV